MILIFTYEKMNIKFTKDVMFVKVKIKNIMFPVLYAKKKESDCNAVQIKRFMQEIKEVEHHLCL